MTKYNEAKQFEFKHTPKMFPATVSNLEQVLLDTDPPKMNFDVKTQIPVKPEFREEMLALSKTGNAKALLELGQRIFVSNYQFIASKHIYHLSSCIPGAMFHRGLS